VKLNSSFIKVILASAIVAILGYVGLDVPREVVEDALDEQLTEIDDTEAATPVPNERYEVVSVTDGDTFKVLQAGEITTVRVIGIDTPETRYSARGEECYGEEASREALRLLEATKVLLQTDSSQDTYDGYGRLLAYAQMEDGRDFGETMIENGFAEEFTYAAAYRKQRLYQAAETAARDRTLGLWNCE